MELKDKVIAEIKKIYDPEIPVNIYDLGLIYDVKVDQGNIIEIKMTLTTPNCPVAESLPKEVEDSVKGIKEVLSKDEKSLGVRIGVKSGGCAGMEYVMEYAKVSKTEDELIEEKGVKVFVDPGAVMYLLGTEMDYKEEEFSSSFVFKNPNETERCGCGESFKIE